MLRSNFFVTLSTQEHAEVAVRELLKDVGQKVGDIFFAKYFTDCNILQVMSDTGETLLQAEDKLDDGVVIALKVNINKENVSEYVFKNNIDMVFYHHIIQGSAVFDFTETGDQMPLNLNTPRQVTYSAVLYCLRCMVGYDVPLNQACAFSIVCS